MSHRRSSRRLIRTAALAFVLATATPGSADARLLGALAGGLGRVGSFVGKGAAALGRGAAKVGGFALRNAPRIAGMATPILGILSQTIPGPAGPILGAVSGLTGGLSQGIGNGGLASLGQSIPNLVGVSQAVSPQRGGGQPFGAGPQIGNGQRFQPQTNQLVGSNFNQGVGRIPQGPGRTLQGVRTLGS